MRRLGSLVFVALLILFGAIGCTTEDKRQWQEAMRDWRGDNIRYRSFDRTLP